MNLFENPQKNVLRCKTLESPKKDPYMSIVMCGFGIWYLKGISELVQIFTNIYPSSPIEKILEFIHSSSGETIEFKMPGYSVKPPHFTHPIEVWDLSSGRYERPEEEDIHFTDLSLKDVKSPISFFLGKKTVIVLCNSIVDDTGYHDLLENWLPLMDDETPRILVESDYMEDGWSLEDDWIKENIKKMLAMETQKDFNCITRFFCSHRDTQCIRDIFLSVLDFLSNQYPENK